MLKFVLRIFVVLAIGFVLSNEVVDRAANYLFESETANYTREAVRGQLHSLKQELAHVPPDARPDFGKDVAVQDVGLEQGHRAVVVHDATRSSGYQERNVS